MSITFASETVTGRHHLVAYYPTLEDRREFAYPLSIGRDRLRLGSSQTLETSERLVFGEGGPTAWTALLEDTSATVDTKVALLKGWLAGGTKGTLVVSDVGTFENMRLVTLQFGVMRTLSSPTKYMLPFSATWAAFS